MKATELYWLSANPSWRSELAAIGEASDELTWNSLVSLAQCQIDPLQTIRLDRRLTRLFSHPPAWVEGRAVRLAVLASSTVDHLLPALRIGALRRGLHLLIYVSEYGQYTQELMDANSALHAFQPDTILFSLDAHHLTARLHTTDTEAALQGKLNDVMNEISANCLRAKAQCSCNVIQQTVLPVFHPVFGNNEQRLPGSRAGMVDSINHRLRGVAEADGFDLLAIDGRVCHDGLLAWHDPALWFRAKQEVHPTAADLYGDLVGRLIAARRGRSSKCLVLDLDNTLWGGVIGDDGMQGIILGQGSALGEAFSAFQECVLSFARRGVILAVCSKNDEARAIEPFDNHPDMVLRRGDVACFVANWTDKATNIRSIASALNIGLDSLVFVDDNPFERELVRRELPMVAVPELPPDPALWEACIADAGYFESVQLTHEDRLRGEQYKANLERELQKSASSDIASYLSSLQMTLGWSRFDRLNLARIVQLINKTNQFNLTTKRTNEAAVASLIADDNALTLQLRLTDIFGDNGIIAIVIGRFAEDADHLLLDTWLMSCRVLGRRVEEATLNLVIAEAARLGAKEVLGTYIPSPKNAMVSDLYPRLGFSERPSPKDGQTLWAIDVDTYRPADTPIEIVKLVLQDSSNA